MKRRIIFGSILVLFLFIAFGGAFMIYDKNMESKIFSNEIDTIYRYSLEGNENESIGYRIENGTIKIWNTEDEYFFDEQSGIQFTNYYDDYWTQNVFCGGYYNSTPWICIDTVPFSWTLNTDNLTYVNYTGYYDISLTGAKLRLGINYHLKLNDKNLSVELRVDNIGNKDITKDLGFTWKVKDIRINGDSDGDLIYLNDSTENPDSNYSEFDLNNITETLTFIDMEYSSYILFDNAFIRLDWDNNLDYIVEIKNDTIGNAIVDLNINFGNLLKGESKGTTIYWRDPISPPDNVGTGSTASMIDGMTWNHEITCGDNMVLIVGISVDSEPTSTVNTITYDGDSLTLIQRDSSADNEEQGEMWNLTNPSCGSSLPIVVTYSGATKEESAGISAVYYNVDYINLSSISSAVSSGSTSSTLDTNSQSADNWVVNVFALDVDAGSGISITGDNATQRGYSDQGDTTIAIGDGYSPDGTVTLGWTGFNDEWVQIGVELIPNELPTVLLNTTNETSFSSGTPTLDFTGYDLEEDDIEYNIQVDTNYSFDSQQEFSLTDNYYPIGDTSDAIGGEATFQAGGQSFTATEGLLGKVTFQLSNTNSPTGSAYAVLYAHSGTYGISSVPTGTPLATSEPIDTALISGVTNVTFTFSGAEQYSLVQDTHYFISFNYTGGDSTNYVQFRKRSDGTHEGNYANFDGSWTAIIHDSFFWVYIKSSTPLIDNSSLTDTGFPDGHPWLSGQMINFTTKELDDGTYYWRVRGGGTYENGEWSEIRQFTISGEDTTPPTYSNDGTNTTIVSEAVKFHLLVDDDSALQPNGQYIFSTNNSGSWVNDTAITFSSTPEWANVTKTLPASEDTIVGYMWYLNDTLSNNASTPVYTLTTTSADTCTYTSGAWEVDCSDNCVISSPVSMDGSDLSIIGTGTFTMTSDITGYGNILMAGTDESNICKVNCYGGCFA